MPKVPTSPGSSIALKANIAGVWTDAADPVSLSEFYRNGTNITNASNSTGAFNFVYGNIPTSGQIKFSDFSNTGFDVIGSIIFDNNTFGSNGFTAYDTDFTWTVPVGANVISAVVIGAGGAGGETTVGLTSSQINVGAGGGGGGLRYGILSGLVGGSTQLTIRVGSGGVSGAGNTNNGGYSQVTHGTDYIRGNGGTGGVNSSTSGSNTSNTTGGYGGSGATSGATSTGGGTGGRGGHARGNPWLTADWFTGTSGSRLSFCASGGGCGGYAGSGGAGSWAKWLNSGEQGSPGANNSGAGGGGKINNIFASYNGYLIGTNTTGYISLTPGMLPTAYSCGGPTALFGRGGIGYAGSTAQIRNRNNQIGSDMKFDPSRSDGSDYQTYGGTEYLIPSSGAGFIDMGTPMTSSNPGVAPSPGGGGAGCPPGSQNNPIYGLGMSGGNGAIRIVWGVNKTNNTNDRRYPNAEDVAGEEGEFPT